MDNMYTPGGLTGEESDTIRTLAYVLKPKQPDAYVGKIDAMECLNFMDGCEEYYSVLQVAQPLWVKWMVLNLTGSARSWWCTSGLTIETPWPAFRAAFIARFTPSDSVNKARESIKELKQGRTDVATFT
ncbi:hypothetical protein BGZ98_006652 [Dissophora globulifera]|nr:hypothetical protein BGZ98_006652 [Dissophora globulifera]